MGRGRQTPRELFELSALCRRSAETCEGQDMREKMRVAALELEARAWKIAKEEQAQGDAAHDPFAHIVFLV